MHLALEHGDRCLTQLATILEEVGKLDDYFQTDLIDNRAYPGAYQYIKRAIARVEEYMYVVGEAYDE